MNASRELIGHKDAEVVGYQLQEDACSRRQNLALQQRVQAAHESLWQRPVPDPDSSYILPLPPVGGSSRRSPPRTCSADSYVCRVKPSAECVVQPAVSQPPLGRLPPFKDWRGEETYMQGRQSKKARGSFLWRSSRDRTSKYVLAQVGEKIALGQ